MHFSQSLLTFITHQKKGAGHQRGRESTFEGELRWEIFLTLRSSQALQDPDFLNRFPHVVLYSCVRALQTDNFTPRTASMSQRGPEMSFWALSLP